MRKGLRRCGPTEGDIVHTGRIGREDGSGHPAEPRLPFHADRNTRASRHFLGVGNIRCLTNEIAVADGKWDLRDVVDANKRAVPPMDGLCSLVLRRSGGGWLIEAYRYTVTPRAGPPPTLLKQPGFLGGGSVQETRCHRMMAFQHLAGDL